RAEGRSDAERRVLIVLGVAGAVIQLAREAQGNLFRNDRNVDRAFDLLTIVFADFALDITPEAVGRRLGIGQDRAAERVTAEQRALRTLEDLDVVHVVGRDERAVGRQRYFVEVGQHGRGDVAGH